MKIKFLRFPEGKTKAVTLSYDDGVEQDARLISLMEKYGFKGTFNLNSGCFAPNGKTYPEGEIYDRRMSKKDAINLYKKHNMEIACHSETHTFLERLPFTLALKETVEDRRCLEELSGKPVHGFAYPFGTYSDETFDVMKAAGIYYARTVESSKNFKLPENWLCWNPTCHHNDPELEDLAEFFANEDVGADPLLFYIWGHSYEFDEKNNWNVIEELMKNLSGREDTWYATNIEIYNYVRAYESLDFSVDMNFVTNPTATDVWILAKGKHVKVPKGKTVRI